MSKSKKGAASKKQPYKTPPAKGKGAAVNKKPLPNTVKKGTAAATATKKAKTQRLWWVAGVVGIVALLGVGLVLILHQGQSATPETSPTAAPTAAVPATASSGMPADPAARNGMYTTPPPMTIDPAKTYIATIETEKGNIVVQLYADKAPTTVNNFVFLARQGFYDNTTFHRVMADFMAQAGDPTGSGSGGPGYQFADEFDDSLKFDGPGVMAMANAGANTNGSQFFITFVETPWLNGKHTIFGKVIEGLDILPSISLRDPQTATTPGDLIKTIRITEK
ncbi:MAG TPA: peptidylprolyl isomerase [Anaerolineae bacterium]|nr:peptidylprolyl isomerase [Anaerolineae bacterium]HQH37433.1 peptidylprolyl isomerase [Anaerolineae bacterium]